MAMGDQELKDILEKHGRWVRSEQGGERALLRGADLRGADLYGADLRGADLYGADLYGADLYGANLYGADLYGADLYGADLYGANLYGANLYGANLSKIKEDFFKRLSVVKSEIQGLYDFLQKGKIDGSCYEGECCCFVGSIAKIRNENYMELSCSLKPEASSATEQWFTNIRPGDTPASNQVSKITSEWMEEFMKNEGIEIPKYRIVSSTEAPELFLEEK